MASSLTPVSISYKTRDLEEKDALVEAPQALIKHNQPAISRPSSPASTPEEALEILRNEPDYEAMGLTLAFLENGNSGFKITTPSPLAAQLVHVLVSGIIPNYWSALHASDGKQTKGKSSRQKQAPELIVILSFLQSVTGLNAILLGLKQLVQKSKEPKKFVGGPSILDNLKILLQALTEVLDGDGTIEKFWSNILNATDNSAKQRTLWQEFLSLIGNGKIIGIAAEAEDVINDLGKEIAEKQWVAGSSSYSAWASRNITHWAKSLSGDEDQGWKACGDIFEKMLRLGHSGIIVKECVISFLLQRKEDIEHFLKLLGRLSISEQRNVLSAILKLISQDYLSATVTSTDDAHWWHADRERVSAAARLVNILISGDDPRKSQLVTWLTGSSEAGLGDGIAIRRATVAALSENADDLESVLDKSLKQFGDQLYIRHTPTLQQEVHAQVLLLAGGYVHRKSPLRLARLMRAGSHMGVVSNRLAASSPRARFLGMAVGEALSGLVDKGDKRLDFKVEEMNSAEAKWYKGLVNVTDTIGSLDALKPEAVAKVSKQSKHPAKRPASKSKAPVGGSKIISIEEVEDDDEQVSSDDGLTPYAKPDSDAEDSDEDPTLITRNKPKAPVYIRDLITYLRDTDNYDRQKLALSTASSLIRRKANFGTEVSSHAEELATLLVGLQDKYNLENFQNMRLQGMIAVLVAQPEKMGQWFSKTFFDGDYSISQRAAVLTTLGLGARELGGFGTEDSNLTSTKALSSTSFPSKTLPENMHKLYALPSSPSQETAVDKLSSQLSNTMIAPMAASLADKLTGPSILKVRTFSSRLAVEKKRKKPIANSLAKIVAESFFFPLTGRFFTHLKAYGSSRSNVVFQPYLLTLFIKTLSLLIHASGPSTLSLPQMTAEFWDLLLSLRTQSIGDIMIIEALLFAFLTILEINEDKRLLVEAHGRQMLETQEWVEGIFGRVGAGGSDEDEKVRMLAAGCLVRIREVVEKYQALLMGDLVNY